MNHLLGNEPIKHYLERALEAQQLHHTLLFSGPSGVGKSLFAHALAQRLLNSTKEQHPDLHVYQTEGKSGTHSIEQLREMIDEVHKPPFEAQRKVFILHDAERMPPSSANALLKTLEEPDLDSTIILLTSAPSLLLPTILSRAICLSFQPIAQDEIATYLKTQKGYDPAKAELTARLCNGSLGQALELTAEPASRRLLFDALAGKIPPFQAIEEIEEALEPLEGLEFHQKTSQLLADFLMYVRDQEVKRSGGDPKLLYFPQEEGTCALTLFQAQGLAATIRDALERNIKLSACLSQIFSI